MCASMRWCAALDEVPVHRTDKGGCGRWLVTLPVSAARRIPRAPGQTFDSFIIFDPFPEPLSFRVRPSTITVCFAGSSTALMTARSAAVAWSRC